MAAGCVTVPTYTTNTERDHQHILDDSGARAVIVSTQKLARTLLPAAIRIVALRACDRHRAAAVRPGEQRPASTTGTALIAAEPRRRRGLRAPAPTSAASDLACIIYTRGTGGAPRGVMQHHGAILHNVEGCTDVIAEDFGWDDEVFLSFLPASHAYEHSGGQIFPIGLGAQIYYSEGLEKLASNIEEVRPTIMVVVPRLFEVLRQRILKTVEKQGELTNYLMRPRARDRRQGLCRAGAALGQADGLPARAARCGPRSAPGSAAGSRRWCRAARRSIPRSASSSTRSASPCSRATARPRRRR